MFRSVSAPREHSARALGLLVTLAATVSCMTHQHLATTEDAGTTPDVATIPDVAAIPDVTAIPDGVTTSDVAATPDVAATEDGRRLLIFCINRPCVVSGFRGIFDCTEATSCDIQCIGDCDVYCGTAPCRVSCAPGATCDLSCNPASSVMTCPNQAGFVCNGPSC